MAKNVKNETYLDAEQKYIDSMEPPAIPKTFKKELQKVTLQKYGKKIYAEIEWRESTALDVVLGIDEKDKTGKIMTMVRQMERILSVLEKQGIIVELKNN